MRLRLSRRPASPTPAPARRATAGFTLVEVMVATAVSSLVALITLGVIGEGARLIRSTASTMLAHNTGSAAIRKAGLDLQQGNQVRLFPNYLSAAGAAGQFGSCAVVNLPNGTTATYYLAPNPADATNALFYHPGVATVPNPAADKALVTSVQDLEFRRDALGSVRIGFKVAVYGYPTLALGGNENDLVRFSTSSLPRN